MDRRSKSKNHALSCITALCTVICAGIVTSNPAFAEETSKGMSIYGQSELPKTLYIVPWKQREAGAIDMPSSNSLANDILEPIDPEIFRRQIHYYELLTQDQNKQNKTTE